MHNTLVFMKSVSFPSPILGRKLRNHQKDIESTINREFFIDNVCNNFRAISQITFEKQENVTWRASYCQVELKDVQELEVLQPYERLKVLISRCTVLQTPISLIEISMLFFSTTIVIY